MIWFVVTAVALIATIAIPLVRFTIRPKGAYGERGEPVRRHLPPALMLVPIGAWLAVSALMSLRTVNAGDVGIVYQFGSIVSQRNEGLVLIAPWQSMVTESIKVHRFRFGSFDGEPPDGVEVIDQADITSFSLENQDVFIKATVNVRVDPSAVQQLYRTVGSRWASILVQPRVLNFFKEETVRYTSTDIAPKREQIRVSVRDRLKQELAPYSITVEDVLIDNIDFRAEFKQAIEAKNIATQNALEAQNRVAQKEAEARQAIATANGAATVVKIQAEAQANANRLLADSLTPELIQYQYVSKLAPNARVILLPSGTPFLLNSDVFEEPAPTQTPTPAQTPTPTP